MQKSNKPIAVGKTVSTMEFFQWYTGLKDREQIVDTLMACDAVWDQHDNDYPLVREEIERLLNTNTMTIDSYLPTPCDCELYVNGNLIIIIADETQCPFI